MATTLDLILEDICQKEFTFLSEAGFSQSSVQIYKNGMFVKKPYTRETFEIIITLDYEHFLGCEVIHSGGIFPTIKSYCRHAGIPYVETLKKFKDEYDAAPMVAASIKTNILASLKNFSI